MMKLNILNMKIFLAVVNTCSDAVYIETSDGKKADIRGNYELQEQLMEKYRQNKNSLPLSVSIKNPSDYMDIVSYYAGDC